MVNILLKAFDGEKYRPMLREAFRGCKIGTCISITNLDIGVPDIECERFQWMAAKPLRHALYPDVEWNTIAPLDAVLIEHMRRCEEIFYPMVDRYARQGDIPYAERKRQYLRHLRYWNHMLDQEKIGLFLINHIPHQCFDYVIYELCRLKGIPTYHIERCYSVEGTFLVRDVELSAEQLVPALERLRKEYADPSLSVPLSPSYEAFFQAETTKGDKPWFTGQRPAYLARTNFFAKWIGKAVELLRHKPLQFLRAVTSPDVWSRKLAQHHSARFYDAAIYPPDFSVPYIYVPLHMQPEETTSPRAGAFVNQELIVQLIAACVPPDVQIYVKEHPAQGELCRSEAFYRSMSELPQVRFMPRDADTFALAKHAVAVATATGTAGFEGLFRGTPVLMFGHRFYQYAPGVYRIQSVDDCRRALQEILVDKKKPILRDMRIFLKAVEETTVPYEGGPLLPGQAPREERAAKVGAMMRGILESVFS